MPSALRLTWRDGQSVLAAVVLLIQEELMQPDFLRDGPSCFHHGLARHICTICKMYPDAAVDV